MFKKVFALLLCVLMLIPCLSACAQRNEDDMGAFITMYLTDEIYNFDPAYANYNNGTRNIVSLMFETLFTLDADGKVQNSLVNSYKYTEDFEENEFTLQLNLKNTSWSNGLPVTADDVVYAWKRLLNPNNSFEAASLLFDIKNARAVKEGDESIDNLGVEASAQEWLPSSSRLPFIISASFSI
jgi:ABC-type oligopeptide transport system substrate-binding subunit